MLKKRRMLERLLLAVGMKLAKSKKFVETSRAPSGEVIAVKTLRCIRLEDSKDKNASPVHFIDKDYGDVSFKFFGGESFFEDEDEVLEKLREAREFMWIEDDKLMKFGSYCLETTDLARWRNPFFGCKSLEEMLVRADLLAIDSQKA